MAEKANPTSVLTVGNFDGLHLGHAAILAEARRRADRLGAEVVAVTFDPTPVGVLRPGQAPPQLMSAEARVRALRDAGADRVELLTPTPQWLGQSAEDFVAEAAERYRVAAWVEGTDFRFGQGRRGDMAMLETLGNTHGFEAITVPRVSVELSDGQSAPVSSSLVRWLVGRGRVRDAALGLGRPYALAGTVVKGEQRGRTLGIPTANLDPAALAGMIVPADGVYAAWATLCTDAGDDAEPPIPAAVSVGVKPTFDRRQLTVEAHLLDTDRDLYGRTLRLRFDRWLRDQYAFPGLAALTAQLRRDLDAARLALQPPAPASP